MESTEASPFKKDDCARSEMARLVQVPGHFPE